MSCGPVQDVCNRLCMQNSSLHNRDDRSFSRKNEAIQHSCCTLFGRRRMDFVCFS